MSSSPASLVETHSSVVVFFGDRAYKVRKPLDLGFVDFTSREARERASHRELELNRRLAPDVYLGVADVVGADGDACDHLVVMRRMPADRRLSTLAAAGADLADGLRQVARTMAAFHESAASSPVADEAAGAAATARRWATNTAEMEAFPPGLVDPRRVASTQALAEAYIAGRSALFESRVHEGRARDGHGDLIADDIFLLDDGPRILDCLDFDESLRVGDVLADVAFLAMDLERLGRADLAAAFLADYREFSADTWPGSLAHHQVAYRAQVRAKVAAIRAGQGDPAAVGTADRLLDLALGHLRAGTVRCVVVGGLPGTGKSTLAAAVADDLDATVLRSDEVRRELVGSPEPGGPHGFGTGRYSPEVTARVYDEMFRRARSALGLGDSVVLDASFADPDRREDARRLGRDTGSEITEIECTAPAAVAAGRIRRRAEAGGDPSEATPAVADAMAQEFPRWPQAHRIDTDRDPAEVLESARATVSAPPGGDGAQ